jgi:hypothetical protein
MKPKRNVEAASLAVSLAAPGSKCPIPFSHDRLHEVHHWWHEMARNYHEPEPFRYALGALIQAARNVTFMLQKEQSVFSDFTWYREWSDRAKKDAILSWLSDTRTDFVHRKSLEPQSWLEMRCVGNPRHPHGPDEDPFVFKVSPFECTHYYISIGPSVGDHTHEFTRHWGIEGLNGGDLLHLCADIYDRLDELLVEAHRKLGASMTSYRTECCERALPCMLDTMKHRVVCTVLRDGREVWEDEPPGLHGH